MAIYFHGSGSASLAGVLSNDTFGLMSTGELLKQGKVPYCGELDYLKYITRDNKIAMAYLLGENDFLKSYFNGN